MNGSHENINQTTTSEMFSFAKPSFSEETKNTKQSESKLYCNFGAYEILNAI